jgi:transcriptional regulator with XRE-family HTH domain
MEHMKVDGGYLTRRRLELGLAQIELARKAGVDPGLISRAERGIAGMHMSSLRKVAVALEVPVTELYAVKLDALPVSTSPPAAA